jgi:FkbM family methyltransferase
MREVTRGGAHWIVSEPSKSEYSFWTEFENGTWEQETLDIVDRFVTPNSTFLDIGAWTGPLSMWAARLGAQAIAIEPDPVAVDYLNLHVAMNGADITIIDGAISDHTGTTHIQPHEFGWGSTMTQLSDTGREVQCWTLPDLFDWYDIENVSLAKMDIEGGESIVLEHAAPFLAGLGIPLFVSMHEPWWSRPVERSWFDGYSEIQGELHGWQSVLALP